MQQVTKQDLVEQLAEAMSSIEYAIWMLNENDTKSAQKLLESGMITATSAVRKLTLLAANERRKQ